MADTETLASQIAAAEAATNPSPTPEQIEAGDYDMGSFKVKGLKIVIETPKGAIRKGVTKKGKAWSIKMQNSYGYIDGFKPSASDGDDIDVFVGSNPDSELVHIIDQNNPETGEYDEHKVVLFEVSEEDAIALYQNNYSKGWTGFRSCTALTWDQFKSWLIRGDTGRPMDGQLMSGFHKRASASRVFKRPENYDTIETFGSDKDLKFVVGQNDWEDSMTWAWIETVSKKRPAVWIKIDPAQGRKVADAWIEAAGKNPRLDDFIKALERGVDGVVDYDYCQHPDIPDCVAVDLDGTLAYHDSAKPFDPDHVGRPLRRRVEQVKSWIRDGVDVIIFTARASDPTKVPPVLRWLKKQGLPPLTVTNEKTPNMGMFFDDRATAAPANENRKFTEKKAALTDRVDMWDPKAKQFRLVDVQRLIERVKDRDAEEVDLSRIWGMDSVSDLDEARVAAADTQYPLLVDDYSEDTTKPLGLVDGRHRFTKLRREGQTRGRVVRLTPEDMAHALVAEKKAASVPTTGPGAIMAALAEIDLDALLEKAKKDRRAPSAVKRDASIRLMGLIDGLKRNEIQPHELMVRSVPVIPPAFRPITTVGEVVIPGDVNVLYGDLFRIRKAYEEARNVFGEAGAGDARIALYDAMKAVSGHGDAVNPKSKAKGVVGFLKAITGSNPKYCYDDETDILTRSGWVKFSQLAEGVEVATINPDSLAFEWQMPDYYTHARYIGKMVHIKVGKKGGLKMDLLVTPNHRMWHKIRNQKPSTIDNKKETFTSHEVTRSDWRVDDAASYLYSKNRRWFMVSAPEWQEGRTVLPEAVTHWDSKLFAEFFGWWLAEGDTHSEGYSATVWQTYANEPYMVELEAMFKRIREVERVSEYPTKAKQENRHDGKGFAVLSQHLVQWLDQVCGRGCGTKRIPREVLDWDKEHLEILWRAYMKGDGGKRAKYVKKMADSGKHKYRNSITDTHDSFNTTSPGLFEDLAELGFKIGVCVRRQKEHPHLHPEANAEIFNGGVTGRWFCQTESSMNAEFVDYDGHVHCCSVPNGLLVVRRNGALVVSGNSFVQRKLLSKPRDNVSRGVIIPNPDLSIDEIGLPENNAWASFGSFVMGRLVRGGMREAEALKAVAERNEQARQALLAEMAERPVLYSRAPAWHKQNAVAGFAKLVEGDAIHISNMTATGLNADYDGDTINTYVPALPKSVQEAKDRLLPSKMVFSVKDPEKVVPVPKHELIWGPFQANNRPATAVHKFSDMKSALMAIEQGDIDPADEVEVPDIQNAS